jgi:hypothetical protein
MKRQNPPAFLSDFSKTCRFLRFILQNPSEPLAGQ